MEVSKLSDIEFRVMVKKMLKDLSKNYKKLNWNFSRNLMGITRNLVKATSA